MDLEVKDSPLPDYGLPNLYGALRGKEVYVHPVKRKKQKSTVYALSNSINFEGDILITSPKTTDLEADLSTFNLPLLEREGLEVRSKMISNRKLVEKIFTEKEVEMLIKLVEKKGDVFRAFIIEPGICMFSTYWIPENVDKIKTTLNDLADLVESLESNITKDEVDNERFEKIARKNNTVIVETGMMLFFLSTGILFVISVPVAFSWIGLNLGAILILISLLRIYFIAQTRGWLSKQG